MKILKKNYKSTIQAINKREDEFSILSDLEIKEEFNKLKEKVKFVKTKSNLPNKEIITIFALTREISKRTIKLRHYDTQLLGGLILNEGKIIEMQTGEGKTLVASLPTVANAITQKGVHIITVNDYLAQRDAEWVGQIYRFLDFSVGLVYDSLNSFEKKNNYDADITYLTNSILGFDFLKDNLVSGREEVVQRPFNFCIIDEVDSILIDEAKTPLIISEPDIEEIDIEKITNIQDVVQKLEKIKDFEINEKTRTISLTESGFDRVKYLLKINNLYECNQNNWGIFNENVKNQTWIYYILNALQAKYLFFKNVHYVVQDNEIIIVDEATGRLMPGRKWSDGLHEAISVKENILELESTINICSITYQTLFRIYPKLSGMTGTAKTDELEFIETYNLPVIVIPTFRPSQRVDLPDLIYINEMTKWNAVCEHVNILKEIGRPILIGTPTIESSDLLSSLLNYYSIGHELLNARPENIIRESEIIAQAGRLKSVTLATNMAGRGTDILLGGNPEFQAKIQLQLIFSILLKEKHFNETDRLKIKKSIFSNLLLELKNNFLFQVLIAYRSFEQFFEFLLRPIPKSKKFDRLIVMTYQFLLKQRKQQCQKEAKIIKDLGGLYVIGTERHNSRRIDNQLRGRAGRQGDPGTSRFYLSANDKLIRVFAGNQFTKVLEMFKYKKRSFQSKFVSKIISSSQRKVESMYYEQRQGLNKYDLALDKQYFFILKLREIVLDSYNLNRLILLFFEEFINELIELVKTPSSTKKNKNKRKNFPVQLTDKVCSIFTIYNINLSLFYPILNDNIQLKNFLHQQILVFYYQTRTDFWSFEINLFSEYQKIIFLNHIDQYWAEHLETMNFLKESIGWQAYSQRDPLLSFLEKSNFLFKQTLINIRNDVILEFLTTTVSDLGDMDY